MKILVFKFSTIFLIPIFLAILYIIRVKYRVRIALLNVNRIGHLAINTEVTLREAHFKECCVGRTSKERVILVAPSLPYHNASNSQLVKMFSRHKNVYQSWFFYRFISVWYKFLLKTPFFFSTKHAMNGEEYKLFNNINSTITFNLNEIDRGSSVLKKIGIGSNKYVCIFQRDSNYLYKKEGKSQEDRSCRDANIDTMIPSIKYLIKKGYYVIRVGSQSKNKVSYKNKMFIDYPFTKYISDFNDMYIIANSTFLVGSTSGICDIATLFDVPRLVVNAIPFGHSTIGKKTMFIPKKISKKGNIMPYFDKSIKLLVDNYTCDLVKEKGCEYVDNTESEILFAVKDFIEYLSCNGVLSSSYLMHMNNYFSDYLRNTLFDSVNVPLCPSWYYSNYKLYNK